MRKQDKWMKNILWFESRNKCDLDLFDMLTAQRTVSKQPRFKSGTFYSEKCKREIQYESGIELDFIKRLEKADQVLLYCEQPVRIPYMRGKIRQHTTPDFAVLLNTLNVVIVEIKPIEGLLENRVQMKAEGLIKYCHKMGFGLLLTDGRDTLEKIKKLRYNRKLEREILHAIDGRILRKKECSEILKKHNATHNELLKIILKNHLKYKSYPFKLQQGNKNDLFQKIIIEQKRYDDLIRESLKALFKS